MRRSTRSTTGPGWAVAGAILICTPLALAQVASEDTFLPTDEAAIEALLRSRPVDEIAREMESAKARLSAAEADAVTARGQLTRARGRIEVKDKELALLKEQVKLAKQEKDEARRLTIEAKMKAERERLGLFERVREAFDAATARAEAAIDFQRSRIEAQEAEQKIAEIENRRVALRALETADPLELKALDQDSREAVRTYLKRVARSGERSAKLAKATERLAERKLDLLEAWNKADAGKSGES